MDVANDVFRKASHKEPLEPAQSMGTQDYEVNPTFCRNLFDRVRGIPFYHQVFNGNSRRGVRGTVPKIFLKTFSVRLWLGLAHPLAIANVLGAKSFDGMEHEHRGITESSQVNRDSKSLHGVL
jgi:hypothetical protein